jgi:hypothetical protein
MKHVLYLFLISVLFGSCKKDQIVSKNPAQQDARPTKIITSDTLTSGQLWGLNIGDTITNVYKTIQYIQTEKRINYLGIVGNVFTGIDQLESTIPLYTSIFLDEKNGTENGIQIYFQNNKVSAIWTNAGAELSKWPSNTDKASTIEKNAPIENIYSTLNNIKRISAFTNKFERISLFYKDINKAYDIQMSKSPQWHFTATVNDKRYYVVHLNFSAGILTSIYSTLYEQL